MVHPPSPRKRINMTQKTTQLRICTWNVCLGARTKLPTIKTLLHEYDIDILCIQEADIKPEEDVSDYRVSGYELETEKTTTQFKIRSLVYIKTEINYKRLEDDESENSHIILVKVKDVTIAAMYRTYQLTHKADHASALNEQIETLEASCLTSKHFLLLGDINLDAMKRTDPSYHHRALYDMWMEFEARQNLVQMVEFPTWCRIYGQALKQSTLDHVYSNCSDIVGSVHELSVSSSDHCPILVTLQHGGVKSRRKQLYRDWSKYSKENLLELLSTQDWDIRCQAVQDYNNQFERNIMQVLHTLVPFKTRTIRNDHYSDTKSVSWMKKRRKNMYTNAKRRNSAELMEACKKLDKKIIRQIKSSNRQIIRNKILQGGAKGLWEGYRIATDRQSEHIPPELIQDGLSVSSAQDKADLFAQVFKAKVQDITENTVLDPDVSNGKKLTDSENKNFFTYEAVRKALQDLKSKRSYGFDNIPTIVLKDGADVLARPLYELLTMIYEQKMVPEQWRTSRLQPLFKKGNRKDAKNYRPISNLCAASKIFERLILARIVEIGEIGKVDLFGKTQHGFRKQRSTTTAALELQAKIAELMDKGHYVAVASLDLSAAFDVINIELLLTRMGKMGMAHDVVDLTRAWLSGRSAYVEVNGECSAYFEVTCGTVQGSVLGPVLFNLFMSPFVTETNTTCYADDGYCVASAENKTAALSLLQQKVTRAEQWMSGSGLAVNITKTELAVFHRYDSGSSIIKLRNMEIKSKPVINVLGVLFDTRLTWDSHVDYCITGARKSLHVLRTIRLFFTEKEMANIITSIYYSKLYYGAQVWLLPDLKERHYKRLYSESGRALKLIDRSLSHRQLHKQFCRATPRIYSLYLTSTLLHSYLSDEMFAEQKSDINTIVTNETRNRFLTFVRNNKFKCGLNCFRNRLRPLSNVIAKTWLHLSSSGFKLKAKINIIQYQLTLL